MKTDLNSIKEELRKLTDLDYLKTELAKIASEIKGIDLRVALSPQAKGRLRQLEKRFKEIRRRIGALQKQVDGEVNKFMKILRKTKDDAEKRFRGTSLTRATTKKKTSKKTSGKTTTRKATAKKSSAKT